MRSYVRTVLVVLVAMALLVLGASAATAQAGDASPDAPAGATLTINNLLVTLLLGAVLPIAIGFVQRPTNPGWVKVIVGAALTALAVGISEALQEDGSALLSQEWAVDYLIAQAAVIGSYLGVWQPVFQRRGGVNTLGPSVVPRIGPQSPPPVPLQQAA